MNALMRMVIWAGGQFCAIALPLLIQSTLVIGVVWLADSILAKRISRTSRYRLWMAALVCSIAPLWPVFGVSLAAGPTLNAALAVVLTAAWLIGVAAFTIVKVRRSAELSRIARDAEYANGAVHGAFRYCRSCMDLDKAAQLKISRDVGAATIRGFISPIILLPHDLAPTFGSRHLRAVLLRELARIKGGDMWVNLAQTVLQTVYFFSAPVWLTNSKLTELRRQLADRMVIEATNGNLRWYRQSLADIANLALKA
jgi:beta-lactamase regulating signal transducer with metallopeptidase domain